MPIRAAAATDVGRIRSGNEDSYHCGSTVFAVADGLGGHAAGEVASALAVQPVTALDGVTFDSAADAQSALAQAIRGANQAVREHAAANPEQAGMGTTLTAAVIVDDQAALAHVGDSRAYLMRDGALQQLTVDHTAVQEAVDAGWLTPAQARVHPERSTLTRALGLSDDVSLDAPAPILLQAGDRLLLCSDGLTEVVDDPAIADLLGRGDAGQACDALVQAALVGGGPDNITVVVVAAS